MYLKYLIMSNSVGEIKLYDFRNNIFRSLQVYKVHYNDLKGTSIIILL